MKLVSLRLAALALISGAALFALPNHASASVNVGIQIGGPPPPPPAVVYQPWAPPYRSAVWIPGHYEVVRGAWVWVGGYYAYPPYRGAVWHPGRYRRGYWHPGYWR